MKAKLYTGVVLVALISVIAGLVAITSQAAVSGNIVARPSNAGNIKNAPMDGSTDPTFGSANTAVTIIEYSDFQCPFCARVVPTINQIKEKYGDSVKIIFKDFPLSFHENAQKAAEAGQCANEQGMFWEYHDTLFANQASLGVSSLKQYAANLGLDTEQFNSCLDSGKYASEVQQDFNSGKAAGVDGTPAFFVNGRKISGAQPFSVFDAAIMEELKAAGQCENSACSPEICEQNQCEGLTGGNCGCGG